MNLIGIKNHDNKAWRLNIYSKLEKIGYKHKPNVSNTSGYIVTLNNEEFSTICTELFDWGYYLPHQMYEARDEKEFLKLAKQFKTI